MVQVRRSHKNLDSWIASFSHARKPQEIELIKATAKLAQQFGSGSQTPWGENCFSEGQHMGEILEELGLDAVTVSAGIVYSSTLYADLDLEQIKSIEPLVSRLLTGLDKMDLISAVDLKSESDFIRAKSNAENLRKMLLAVVEDVRVVLIKLVEHLCKMRYATKSDQAQQEKLAVEAREVFAPLANRLGIRQLKWELEDLMFRFLQSETYQKIAALLDEKRIDRDKYIHSIKTKIEQALQTANIEANVVGRAKHIYSIWNKMQHKMIPYHEIYDVRAFRVLVPTEKDCYGALGVIHSLWHHIPKEFDDYIANPKENGYQSLHTAVIGDAGKTLEVQIRTKTMHEQAELGVASHWRYKEGLVHDPDYDKKLVYLRQLLDWQESLASDLENDAETLAEDFFEDRIYPLTPAGNVIELPKGATPIDFAYQIHTEVGHRCRGAKVNGKMIPLTTLLNSGDQVHILTVKEGGPSRDWLNPHLKYVQSIRSRSKIHQWFKRQDKTKNADLGRELITRELKRLNLEKIKLESIFEIFTEQYKNMTDFLAAVGGGDLKIAQVLNALQRQLKSLDQSAHSLPLSEKTATQKVRSLAGDEIKVEGVGNLLCQMAKCCKPILGDDIIGYITLEKGVSIHRKDCMNILRTQNEQKRRLIQVSWESQTSQQYVADLSVIAYDRQALLSDVTSLLAAEKISVLSCQTHVDQKANTVDCKLQVEIPGVDVLARILARIQQIPNVIEAKRVMR